MAELIVVGFEGKHRAAEVLGQVMELDEAERMDVHDAVAVYRTDDGNVRIDQSAQPTTKEEAAWGGFLGAVVGATLALPFVAAATVPAAAAALGLGAAAVGSVSGAVIGFDDAATWKDEYGLSDEFVKKAAAMIQPGTSALFVLARASDPDAVAEQFRGYGGRVLRTTLTSERAAKLQQTLAVGSAAPTR